MSQKIFDNDLVAVCKSNIITLTLNKLAYVGMWLLHLSKVLMNESYYGYIKKKNMTTNRYCYSLTLVAWCMKWKLNMFTKISLNTKNCLILAIIQLRQNFMIIQTSRGW